MPVNLVKIDMPFTVMSQEADTDYLLTRLIHSFGMAFHPRAGYFAQMACEKYLKALTIQNSGVFADNTHKLLELSKLCEPYDPYFSAEETKRVLGQFDMFDQVGRYGGVAKFDPLSKGKRVGGVVMTASPVLQVAGAALWTSKHLDDLDGFVFTVREKLDFVKIKWGDRFRQILESEDPMKEVLIYDNRYFKG